MTVGASEKSTFGLVYTHAANSMRRKAFFLVLAVFILLALFYIPQSPVSLPTYSGVDVPTSPDDGMISTAVPEPDHSKEFPKKIWQSASQPMKEEWAQQTESWITMNEEWNYELLTDDINTLFVEDNFQDQPTLLGFWRDLNAPVLHAELVRYLTMLAKGGVYSDVDTTCVKPIEQWIPVSFDEQPINAIIGIEYDDSASRSGRPVNFSRRTMMAQPRNPIFEAVVARVVYHFQYLASIEDTDLADLDITEEEILEVTGPGAFSDAVMEGLSSAMARKVEWSEVQELKEPKLFGDILILPINGFGSGHRHSNSSDSAYGEVLAQRYSDESWDIESTVDKESAEASSTEAPDEGESKRILQAVESSDVLATAAEEFGVFKVDSEASDLEGSEAIDSRADNVTDEVPL